MWVRKGMGVCTEYCPVPSKLICTRICVSLVARSTTAVLASAFLGAFIGNPRSSTNHAPAGAPRCCPIRKPAWLGPRPPPPEPPQGLPPERRPAVPFLPSVLPPRPSSTSRRPDPHGAHPARSG